MPVARYLKVTASLWEARSGSALNSQVRITLFLFFFFYYRRATQNAQRKCCTLAVVRYPSWAGSHVIG